MEIGFLEKILRPSINRYIELEIHSSSYKGEQLKQYVDDVINKLGDHYPQIQVVSKRKSKNIERRTNPYLTFSGYILKLLPNIKLTDLKKRCIELETDKWGGRISDIDIYYKNKKISRKS